MLAEIPKRPLGVLVGEGPGYDEMEEGRPFVGNTGQRLDDAMLDVDLARGRMVVVNATACIPVPGATDAEKMRATKCCRPAFKQQVGSFLKAKLPVLAMGKWACVQTTKVLGHPETTLDGRGFIRDGHLIVTWHPTYAFFHNPWELAPFLIDLERFSRLIKGGIRPGPKLLLTDPSVADLNRLVNTSKWLACDIETAPRNKGEPWTGKSPLLAKLKSIGFGNTEWGVAIWWATASVFMKARVRLLLQDKAYTKVFHNGWYFDVPVLRRYGMRVR